MKLVISAYHIRSAIAATLFVFALTSLPLVAAANSTNVGAIVGGLCNIVNLVREVMGFLVLILFILGAVIYAIGHFLPATGNFKAGAHGWAMGMIIGGIIALILVIFAPYIINAIIQFTATPGGNPTVLPANC